MSMKRSITPLASIIVILTALSVLPGCNTNSSIYDDPNYIRGSELTVTRFYIQANHKIMDKLDSVYFAIDLERSVIYNADSLPVGTPVNKLIPMITVPQTVERVEIVMEDTDGSRKVVNYRENPGDTIDFSKQVTLELGTMNESATRSYRILVNVHKMNPDSLYFDVNARMSLPSRMPDPLMSKTVSRDGKVYTMIEENDGSYTVSSTSDMAKGDWQRDAVTFPAGVDVRSFTAASDAFYILTTDGSLLRSTDAHTWRNPGITTTWTAIIGGYGDKLQGIRATSGGTLMHTQYPMDSYTETALEDGFPTEGFSNMGVYTTKWSATPLGIIVGGRDTHGVSGDTWAFDGERWINISNTAPESVTDGTLIPYFAYLRASAMWLFSEHSIWLLVGGMKADGTPNRTVYLSYDNGVNWMKAPQYMQLPEAINVYRYVDHAVADTPLEADFAPEAWRNFGKSRYISGQKTLPYVINGYNISWNCPYIYLVGGIGEGQSKVNPWIYRGVINRMSFKPLI